jgi:hypothetical protein
MKSISLRILVRQPLKVKRMTRAGKTVQVTDNGQPLWIIQPASAPPVRTPADQQRRRREIEESLSEVLRSARPEIPLSKIVIESRR